MFHLWLFFFAFGFICGKTMVYFCAYVDGIVREVLGSCHSLYLKKM